MDGGQWPVPTSVRVRDGWEPDELSNWSGVDSILHLDVHRPLMTICAPMYFDDPSVGPTRPRELRIHQQHHRIHSEVFWGILPFLTKLEGGKVVSDKNWSTRIWQYFNLLLVSPWIIVYTT